MTELEIALSSLTGDVPTTFAGLDARMRQCRKAWSDEAQRLEDDAGPGALAVAWRELVVLTEKALGDMKSANRQGGYTLARMKWAYWRRVAIRRLEVI